MGAEAPGNVHRCLVFLMMKAKVHIIQEAQITTDAASLCSLSLFKILLNNSMLLPWGNDLIV